MMKIQATSQIIEITPELATEWLSDIWGDQRSIRKAHVDRLVSDMMAGRFRISPDAILRIKGKLANGQHRLRAVVECGRPQSFLVMTSNDEELYKVIDAGLRRTVSDSLIGVPYSTMLPSIARCVIAYNAGVVSPSKRGPSDSLIRVYAVSQAGMVDYCKENMDELVEAASFINPLYEKSRVLKASIAGALYIIGKSANKLNKTKEFLAELYDTGPASAASDLRTRLIANRGSKTKLNHGYIFGIAIKALKSYLQGTRPGILKWSKDEQLPAL